MKLWIVIVTGLFLTLFPAAAPAEAWQFLGSTESGLRLFIDTDSVTKTQGIREARVMVGTASTIVGKIVETRQRERFNCDRRLWGLISYEALDDNGAIVSSKAPAAEPLAMHPVIDDSAGETIFDAVCRPVELTPSTVRRRPQ